MMTPAESTPPSARASRAARRSSGIPATPTQRSPNSRRRRSSTTLPKESPSTKEDSSTNNTEAPVESAALEPPQEPENEAAGTTESIPSDLAEFRREMALEAEGKFVPPPMNDSYATPQRPRPAAPRKSALKNANSRPTSPSGTPGSVLGKRKVLFNETTEYKTIASIHDEEYKREQREMCFVGEVKRRRTSNRLSMDGVRDFFPRYLLRAYLACRQSHRLRRRKHPRSLRTRQSSQQRPLVPPNLQHQSRRLAARRKQTRSVCKSHLLCCT